MGVPQLEARQEEGTKSKAANLSCDPGTSMESGEKPDEVDAPQLL